MSAISGPIAPYSNLPINANYFQPSLFDISAITLGPTTLVTTTENMNYVLGQLCRLLIPPQYGSRQLNNQLGYVISIPAANQVVLNIYSQFFDQFVNAAQPNLAQIIAVGDINTGPINANGRVSTSTIIQGSFINISPQ